jgi:pantothenate kinase
VPTTSHDDVPQLVPAAELAGWISERSAGSQRWVFGLAGPPGCGKSTIAARVSAVLGAPVVPMDGFHLANHVLDRLGLREVKGSPQTFDAQGFVDLVGRMRTSTAVTAPVFDRELDEPQPDRVSVAVSDRFVIVEGNYLLLDDEPWARLRNDLDAVAYVDVPTELRRRRLIARHIAFGKQPDEAEEFVVRSDERNTALVEACRHRAHLFVDG